MDHLKNIFFMWYLIKLFMSFFNFFLSFQNICQIWQRLHEYVAYIFAWWIARQCLRYRNIDRELCFACNIIQMSHLFAYWFTPNVMYSCNMKPDITVSLNRNTFMCLILFNWSLCVRFDWIALSKSFHILINPIRFAYNLQITINTTLLFWSRNLSKIIKFTW